MKHLFTGLAMLLVTMSFGQIKHDKEKPYSESHESYGLVVSLNVDSAEEIASGFDLKKIKEILEQLDDGENFTFEIKCYESSDFKQSNMKRSYKISSNTNDRMSFLKILEKIKSLAIAHYTTQP